MIRANIRKNTDDGMGNLPGNFPGFKPLWKNGRVRVENYLAGNSL
jgi:hypothetical protein